jgi:hypothetical protein
MPEPVKEFRFNFSGQLPGEQLLCAAFEYATAVRLTMAQENRDALDRLLVEGWQRWNGFWEATGVLPKLP